MNDYNIKNEHDGYIFLNDIVEDTNIVFILIPDEHLNYVRNKLQSVLLRCYPIQQNIDVNSLRVEVDRDVDDDDDDDDDDNDKDVDSDNNSKIIDQQQENQNNYKLDKFHKLKSTNNWLKSLEKQYSNCVQLINIGKSYKNNDIIAIKISYRTENKAIFIDGGSHGQNWISSATVNYIINQLLTTKDTSLRSIIENYDWYLVPHINPDGYNYTHYNNRFWSKTVTPQPNCFGVDLNRNWGFLFNEDHVTRFPCIKEYPGIRDFSEKESSAISNYLKTLRSTLFFYLEIDGPDQKIYLPNNNETMRNFHDLQRIVNVGIDKIKNQFGTNYNGTKGKTVQPKSGTSMDWVYENLNVNYSFTFHLPPAYEYESREFFNAKYLMPSSRIIPIAKEVFYGIIEMIKEASICEKISESTTHSTSQSISNSSSSDKSPLNKFLNYFSNIPKVVMDD